MKTILIIDDDPDILDAIKLVLEHSDYRILSTTDGGKTHTLAKNQQPDLIILDYLLSGENGQKICLNLKQTKSTQHIPIIIVSAHPDAKKSAITNGADAFIPKPFTLTTLLSEVESLIGA